MRVVPAGRGSVPQPARTGDQSRHSRDRGARLWAAALSALVLLAGTPRPAPASDGYVTYADPLENAFVLEVPDGWSVHGGMFRLGYSDYRPMVVLRSPDGKSELRLGDVAVPSYATPTAQHGEGEPDDLGAQAQPIFARYRTGREYAYLYALSRFKHACERLVPIDSDWKPSVPGKGEAGSVAFRCSGKGASRTAYVYAKTLVQSPNLWQVVGLASFLVPPGRVAAAEAIVAHAGATFELQTSWIAYQKRMDEQGLAYQIARQRKRMDDLGQQVAAFESRMRGMQEQVDAFERGQSARQQQFQGFDDAINGVTPVVDPLDGRTRDVWTGPKNGYWVDGSGTIVNSALSPGAGFHALQPL